MTPMQFQYLVGLCCSHNHPEAVDITVGDWIMDEKADEERDVDVTVTIKKSADSLLAFKGWEVKKESTPLSVDKVEQLCIKLNDMPRITYKAIVSASGFSKGARNKASGHGVDLFQLKRVEGNFKKYFPALGKIGMNEDFFKNFRSSLLCWMNWSIEFNVSSTIALNDDTLLYSTNGKPNKRFYDIKELIKKSLQESTDQIVRKEKFPDSDDSWPYKYTLYFSNEGVFAKKDGLVQINSITISGKLYWEKWQLTPELYALENVSTGEAFAGAMVTPYRPNDERMVALVLNPDSNGIGINHINLTDKQRNIIHKLKLRQAQI